MKTNEDKLIVGSLWTCTVEAYNGDIGDENEFYLLPMVEAKEKRQAKIIEVNYPYNLVKLEFLGQEADCHIDNLLEFFEPQDDK